MLDGSIVEVVLSKPVDRDIYRYIKSAKTASQVCWRRFLKTFKEYDDFKPLFSGYVECMRCRLLLLMFAVSVRQSVGQSVCRSAQLGFTVQNRLNGSRCCLGWTVLGPKEHCIWRGPWSPTERGEEDSMRPSPSSMPVNRRLLSIVDRFLTGRIDRQNLQNLDQILSCQTWHIEVYIKTVCFVYINVSINST